jgi:hypothetical protein
VEGCKFLDLTGAGHNLDSMAAGYTDSVSVEEWHRSPNLAGDWSCSFLEEDVLDLKVCKKADLALREEVQIRSLGN